MAFSHVWRTLIGTPVSRPTSAFSSLCQQTRDVIAQLGLRRRGCRPGKHHRWRVETARRMTSPDVAGNSVQPGAIAVVVGKRRTTDVQPAYKRDDRISVLKRIPRCRPQPSNVGEVPTIIGNRGQSDVNTYQLLRGCCDARMRICRTEARKGPDRNYQDVRHSLLSHGATVSTTSSVAPINTSTSDAPPPTLYVFNAAAITKPHAVEQLATELTGYKVDVAVITETHLKKKHPDHNFTVNGYSFLDEIELAVVEVVSRFTSTKACLLMSGHALVTSCISSYCGYVFKCIHVTLCSLERSIIRRSRSTNLQNCSITSKLALMR